MEMGSIAGIASGVAAEDVEIQAMRRCVELIGKLDPQTRSRVAVYLSDRFGPQ